MKASNGGHLHTLFDYSHPFLLGGRPTRSPPPTTLAAQVESKQNTEATKLISAVADSISGIRQNGDIDSALPGDPASGDKGYKRADGSSSGNSGCEPAELVGGGKVRLGRRLPRTFLWHGTADATVPFSQSTELAATLRRIGVPTTTYFAPGGVYVCLVCRICVVFHPTLGGINDDTRRTANTAQSRAYIRMMVRLYPHLLRQHAGTQERLME